MEMPTSPGHGVRFKIVKTPLDWLAACRSHCMCKLNSKKRRAVQCITKFAIPVSPVWYLGQNLWGCSTGMKEKITEIIIGLCGGQSPESIWLRWEWSLSFCSLDLHTQWCHQNQQHLAPGAWVTDPIILSQRGLTGKMLSACNSEAVKGTEGKGEERTENHWSFLRIYTGKL